jgi:hypothetical protein
MNQDYSGALLRKGFRDMNHLAHSLGAIFLESGERHCRRIDANQTRLMLGNPALKLRQIL